jgi:protein-S-isoprenylcysteine O-methyltransferase Ste14
MQVLLETFQNHALAFLRGAPSMSLSGTQIASLVLCWLAYAALHSLLASLRLKRVVAAHWPRLAPAYRLAFNLLAVVLLLPPLWLTFAWRGPLLWSWQGGWAWLANGLAVAAAAGFLWSTRYYDMGVFYGSTQWRTREHAAEDPGGLTLSPLHRHVRHPWYSLGLLILWTRDMDEARLTSALCITLYLWLGSLLEERKLLAFHGKAYARYRERVPGLVPWPGRSLSADEAHALCTRRQARDATPMHDDA